jgi:hypothetical protein
MIPCPAIHFEALLAAVIYFFIVEFRGNFGDSFYNPLPRDHSKLHYLEMPIKGKSACQFHSLYDRKTGAIHETKIPIAVFCEYLPGTIFVGRGDGNHPDEFAFLQLLPENARSLVTDAVADEGDGFRKDGVECPRRNVVIYFLLKFRGIHTIFPKNHESPLPLAFNSTITVPQNSLVSSRSRSASFRS